MAEKNRKLRNQFDADSSSSSFGKSNSGNDIFRGISIFVDGFTVPSSQELRGYMMKHGGRFENYFSRQRVTHIVCSNLPDSKMRNLRSFSGGLPVVKPTWVLDSVAANRVLDWVPYQLDQLVNGTRNQQKLSAFFSVKSNSSSDNAENYKAGEYVKDRSQHGQDLTYPRGESSEVRIPEPSSTSSREVFQSDPYRHSTTLSSCCSDDESIKEPLASSVIGPNKQSPSTSGDPNFVENYFKNSRLHFIGTWRSRYRKRYPCMLKGVKHENHIDNALSIPGRSAIIHVDMDCFFVSVILRNLPDLQDKPVAVCHSDSPKGTSEISSANYPARGYGVKAGMFVREAKSLCPHLVIFPYNFKAYEEVADQFYSILHKYCKKVQAVSCDEAFLDVSGSEDNDPDHMASIIRQEIFETTGCTASAGIAGNLLMARLATKAAKPNGQIFIPSEKVDDYMNNLPIRALPGIGHVLAEKLKNQQIQTCGQLRTISKESLQKDFGKKTGDMLWSYCRGIDSRPVEVFQETKSIGAEVNWGVRLNTLKDSQDFLVNLCKEVSLRLQGCGMQGRTITLKIKKRRKDAEEPTKYLGCGDCENLSHSKTVPTATDDVDVLQRISKQLFGSFNLDVREIRGIGLQVSRLESADTAKRGHEKDILSWISSASRRVGQPCKSVCPLSGRSDGDLSMCNEQCESLLTNCGKQHADGNSLQLSISECVSSDINQPVRKACENKTQTLPPLCDLDMKVIESLPPEILSEINEMYNGRLTEFMGKQKEKNGRISTMFTRVPQETEGTKDKGKQPVCSSPDHQDSIQNVTEIGESVVCEFLSASTSCSGSSDIPISTKCDEQSGLMPASLTQVDVSVLQQLPDELKADILELLPAHRTSECSVEAPLDFDKEATLAVVRNNKCVSSLEQVDLISERNLWKGNPPKWVEKFKCSNCSILSNLAELYYNSAPSGLLSSILQSAISAALFPASCAEESEEAHLSMYELFEQYIELKIESDIEEIYICFRLLRRFTRRSEFLLQVYNSILPSLQAYVGEKYGGKLLL